MIPENGAKSHDHPSPVGRCIVAGARPDLHGQEVSTLREACRHVSDWPRLYHRSTAHKVFPLVFRSLLLHCQDLLAGNVAAVLRKKLQTTSTRNLQMTTCLLSCLDCFAAEGIPVIPFKGPIFTDLVFGDPGLRFYRDLDLLVPREYVVAAVNLLRQQGYVPLGELNGGQLRQLMKTDKEFPMIHRKSGICIDVQWELTGGFYAGKLFHEDFLDHSVATDYHGRHCILLADSAMVLYLCLHGTQHLWRELDQVCCLYTLLKKTRGVQWQWIAETARRLGAQKSVHVAMNLVKKLYGSPLPGEAEEALAGRAGETLQYRVLPILYRSLDQDPGDDDDNRRFHTLPLCFLSSWSARLRYLGHLLFVPTRYDWQRFPVPARLGTMLFLIRPFRLLVAAFLAAVGRREPDQKRNRPGGDAPP